MSSHTPKEVYKGIRPYNGYPAAKEHHDSWGMCTTSVEWKTVLTAVLTVMSGMDPHMISWDLVWLIRFCWSVWWFTVGVTVTLVGLTIA